METNQYSNRVAQSTIPPLQQIQTLGTLQYADGNGTPAKVDISGTIDKGFFLSEGEWTCYRRNYFSCVCSFSLTPNFAGTPLQFTARDSTQSLQVFGFAMSISAVVSDNDQHNIELVQHTPKRDKGPIMKPEKIRLAAKQPPTAHPHLAMYPDNVGNPRPIFRDNFSSQGNAQSSPTEHTFERIQFKQATQNNGKRRAAQQYYQLVVELWADIGTQNHSGDQYVKIAFRKSSKMIVRGRSPGHYQNDRRGSQSSGPGGSAGTLGGYSTINSMGDLATNAIMAPGGYGQNFDTRGNVYGMRHHDLSPDTAMISPEDAKAMETTKEYQYYPGPIYESHPDRVEMFHPRSGSEMSIPHMATGFDPNGKVKHEYDNTTLPSIFHPTALASGRRPGLFEGKPSSSGYYPSMMPPSGEDMATMALR